MLPSFKNGIVTAFNDGKIFYSKDGNNLGGGGDTSLVYQLTKGQIAVAMLPSFKNGIVTAFNDGKIFNAKDGNNLGGGGDTSLVYQPTKGQIAVAMRSSKRHRDSPSTMAKSFTARTGTISAAEAIHQSYINYLLNEGFALCHLKRRFPVASESGEKQTFSWCGRRASVQSPALPPPFFRPPPSGEPCPSCCRWLDHRRDRRAPARQITDAKSRASSSGETDWRPWSAGRRRMGNPASDSQFSERERCR
jgi:hypothetical protein